MGRAGPIDQGKIGNGREAHELNQRVPTLWKSIGELAIDDLDVVVSDGFGDTNVAGMNFLDLFDSWNVKGDVMTLKP